MVCELSANDYNRVDKTMHVNTVHFKNIQKYKFANRRQQNT